MEKFPDRNGTTNNEINGKKWRKGRPIFTGREISSVVAVGDPHYRRFGTDPLSAHASIIGFSAIFWYTRRPFVLRCLFSRSSRFLFLVSSFLALKRKATKPLLRQAPDRGRVEQRIGKKVSFGRNSSHASRQNRQLLWCLSLSKESRKSTLRLACRGASKLTSVIFGISHLKTFARGFGSYTVIWKLLGIHCIRATLEKQQLRIYY